MVQDWTDRALTVEFHCFPRKISTEGHCRYTNNTTLFTIRIQTHQTQREHQLIAF